VGTNDGFLRFEPGSGRFTQYGTAEGLADTAIAGIQADRRGYLWMGTLKGISRFDPRTGSFLNYDYRDGLRIREFNRAASCRTPDGRLYFGGINGFVGFSPEEVIPNRHPPPVVLTSLRLFDREIGKPGAATGLREISLAHNENFLTFEFAALDFRVPEKNRFAFRMEGLDRDWVDGGNRNTARYPDLPPGDYVFRVRAANSDGVWNQSGTALRIVITPPFWQAWWFRLAAVIAFVLVSYAGVGLARKYLMLIQFWRRKQFVGRFQIVEQVGRGGSGTVYRAIDRGDGRTVALKVLDTDLLQADARRRFIQEGLICERLEHPNVVRVLARGEHAGRLYYAMEYVEGVTLRRLITEGRLEYRSALCIISALLDILEEIHRAGIIHRDIKPENILITDSKDSNPSSGQGEITYNCRDHLKILDFGLAKILDAATLTRTSLLAGTLQYIPPEHLFGKKVRDPDYDFYALGVIAYELLTGRPPFRTGESFMTIAAIIREEPEPPFRVNPLVPEEVSDFVLRLIEKKPSARWQSYAQIRQALDELLVGLSPDALKDTAPRG
jgi:predicted Ser/Thr protein kinase